MSTDTCHKASPTRQLLLDQIRTTGFNASARLLARLRLGHRVKSDDDDSTVVKVWHNVGIIGAQFAYLRRFVRKLAERTQVHYDADTHATLNASSGDWVLPQHVVDMVAVQEVLALHRGPVVRGWPFGPVNVPFWGETCRTSGTFCKNGGFRNRKALVALRDGVMEHSLRHGFVPTPNRTADLAKCDDRDMLSTMQTRMFFAHKLGCGNTIRC